MDAKKKEQLYFIVEADDLAKYGDMRGSTKEEAEQLPQDLTTDEWENRVVICGVIVEPKLKVRLP